MDILNGEKKPKVRKWAEVYKSRVLFSNVHLQARRLMGFGGFLSMLSWGLTSDCARITRGVWGHVLPGNFWKMCALKITVKSLLRPVLGQNTCCLINKRTCMRCNITCDKRIQFNHAVLGACADK